MATALGVLPPPWELPRTCACPLQAPAGSPHREGAWPRGRGGDRNQQASGPEDAQASLQEPPSARHPGSCGWTRGVPGLQQSPTLRLGRPPGLPRLEPCLLPAGPASRWASQRPPSRAAWARGYLPTPRCPTPLSSRPAPLPSPNCRSSCHRQLSPRLHSKCSPPTVLPTGHCQLPAPSFLSPGSLHHPQALAPGLCIPDLPCRTEAGPHLPCAQEGLVSEDRDRKPERGRELRAAEREGRDRERTGLRQGGGRCRAPPEQGWGGSQRLAWAAVSGARACPVRV